jgi:hypothetical protein
VSKNGKRKRFERELRKFKLEVLASSRKSISPVFNLCPERKTELELSNRKCYHK